MLNAKELLSRFNPVTGTIEGCESVNRRLSDLRNLFIDRDAFEAVVSKSNPIIYTVSTIQPFFGEGHLHCGIGTILPGRIADEYYFTKGHLHSWRAAAEFYVGLRGRGMMILEDESSHDSAVVELVENSTVYVPGNTAHRTVNVGDSPLVYLGIYPADAGHEYDTIEKNNFRKIIVAKKNIPLVMDRKDFNAAQPVIN